MKIEHTVHTPFNPIVGNIYACYTLVEFSLSCQDNLCV